MVRRKHQIFTQSKIIRRNSKQQEKGRKGRNARKWRKIRQERKKTRFSQVFGVLFPIYWMFWHQNSASLFEWKNKPIIQSSSNLVRPRCGNACGWQGLTPLQHCICTNNKCVTVNDTSLHVHFLLLVVCTLFDRSNSKMQNCLSVSWRVARGYACIRIQSYKNHIGMDALSLLWRKWIRRRCLNEKPKS